MKVRFVVNAYEGGLNYKAGDVADLAEKRAKQLVKVGVAKALKSAAKKKDVSKPPMNKMMQEFGRK